MSTAHPADPPPPPRLAVFAADSLLGEAVARDALLRACEVVSAAEDPSLVAQVSPAQQIIGIDPGDPVGLLAALDGASAVILALEPDPVPGAHRCDLSELLVSVVRAMRRTGVGRLVSSSSLALSGEAADPRVDRSTRRAARDLLTALRTEVSPEDHTRELRRCEMLLDGSGTDWTVLRAGRLTDLLGTRRPRLVDAASATDASSRRIAREDLARALVDQALVPGDPGARVRTVVADG
ncbi:hypothetical protein DEO23_06995 [Brachybacterium endophyticum]|uniref:NAD(P)-binding domain-containing protein n=1 Tax=Brachybacterium endophyticum TaxID=2182385 RepID=A0A2U2RLK5_9MICO|nr:NAD(P)H-binding protein [Brachybacterium endophyticum]PWH06675.1 hypothetical protein DEO23_06995 [Brachybacterium endophyticum]